MQKNPKFVSSKQTAPKQADIDNTIVRIKGRLAEKPINRHCNAAVKEGYTKTLDILENHITDITKSSIGDQDRARAGYCRLCD